MMLYITYRLAVSQTHLQSTLFSHFRIRCRGIAILRTILRLQLAGVLQI